MTSPLRHSGLDFGAALWTVIGIAPAEFTGTQPGTLTEIYVLTMMQANGQGNSGMLSNRNAGWLSLIAGVFRGFHGVTGRRSTE